MRWTAARPSDATLLSCSGRCRGDPERRAGRMPPPAPAPAGPLRAAVRRPVGGRRTERSGGHVDRELDPPRDSREPGRAVDRGPPALAALPAWATGPLVWAADLAPVGDRWLLYYSAPVLGLGTGRPLHRGRGLRRPRSASSGRSAAARWCARDAPQTPTAYDVVPGRTQAGLPARRRDRPVAVRRQDGAAAPAVQDPGPAVLDPGGAAQRPRHPDRPPRRRRRAERRDPALGGHRGEPGRGAPRRPATCCSPPRATSRPAATAPSGGARRTSPTSATAKSAHVPDPVTHRCLRAGRRRPRPAGRRHADVLPRLDVRVDRAVRACPSDFDLDEDRSLARAGRCSPPGCAGPATTAPAPVLRPARGQSVRSPRSCGSSHTCGSGPAGTISVGLMSSWTT